MMFEKSFSVLPGEVAAGVCVMWHLHYILQQAPWTFDVELQDLTTHSNQPTTRPLDLTKWRSVLLQKSVVS